MPLLRGVIGLNGERPVPGRRFLPQLRKQAVPRLGTDLLELRERHAVEGGGLFERYLRHQLVDVDVTFFLDDAVGMIVEKSKLPSQDMATPNIFLTARDYGILRAVERCPLTVRQLKALSVTFPTRFGSDRRLQDRLAQLTRAGLLRRFRYAATEGTGPFYFMVSAESFRLLHGQDVPLPSPGLFREIGMGRQHHCHQLADFLVRTIVAAHEMQVTIDNLTRENALRLSIGDEHLYPDGSFTLTVPGRPPFLFYVELDNSTEVLTSPTQRDSWLKKLRFYEVLQNSAPARFRVLGLSTRSAKRIENIAALAASVATNPQRSLFYGTYLPGYLQHAEPLAAPLFRDHRGLHISLIPQMFFAAETATPSTAPILENLARVC